MRKPHLGFSLIELITTMLIVGILAAIAVPGYRSYVLRANRADGKSALLSTASGLERCFTRFNRYNDAGCLVTLPTTVGSGTGTYRIQAASLVQDTFTLQAVPINGQTRDTGCGTLQLNSGNQRTVTGTKPARECWGK